MTRNSSTISNIVTQFEGRKLIIFYPFPPKKTDQLTAEGGEKYKFWDLKAQLVIIKLIFGTILNVVIQFGGPIFFSPSPLPPEKSW